MCLKSLSVLTPGFVSVGLGPVKEHGIFPTLSGPKQYREFSLFQSKEIPVNLILFLTGHSQCIVWPPCPLYIGLQCKDIMPVCIKTLE